MRMDALLRELHRPADTRIVFLIADGLGGLPRGTQGTELEAARTPNLDRLAREGVTGMVTPVAPGITCGSGPGHLALFGYDPLQYRIGRGVLSALGVDFDLRPGDVAARGNFCTVDDSGRITDRRAGRIGSERGAELVRKLDAIAIEGAQVFVRLVEGYRFLLVLRGEGLGSEVEDTDPQSTGIEPDPPRARDEGSKGTAEVVSAFVERAREVLREEHPANMVLLRGFDRRPDLPSMRELYGVRACALAGYPMYRGIARLLGMQVVECGPDLGDEIEAMAHAWNEHDFFFVHHKATDSAGEDGDYEAKVRAIEVLDRHIPRVRELDPDVLVVTGDHSTPSQLRGHSWHPVPVVLVAETCRRDAVECFGETACLQGGLARMPTKLLMALALGHAERLRKYGA